MKLDDKDKRAPSECYSAELNIKKKNDNTPYLGFLLNEAAAIIRRETAKALEPFNLNPRLLGVLDVVARHAAVSQRELGEIRNTDRTTVVAQIDQLEKLGLLERRDNPHDRRGYALFLTVNGERVLGEAGRAAREAEQRFIAGLNQEDCERLLDVLWRLYLNHNPAAKFYQSEEIESLCAEHDVM